MPDAAVSRREPWAPTTQRGVGTPPPTAELCGSRLPARNPQTTPLSNDAGPAGDVMDKRDDPGFLTSTCPGSSPARPSWFGWPAAGARTGVLAPRADNCTGRVTRGVGTGSSHNPTSAGSLVVLGLPPLALDLHPANAGGGGLKAAPLRNTSTPDKRYEDGDPRCGSHHSGWGSSRFSRAVYIWIATLGLVSPVLGRGSSYAARPPLLGGGEVVPHAGWDRGRRPPCCGRASQLSVLSPAGRRCLVGSPEAVKAQRLEVVPDPNERLVLALG
jgi:hypothetical protein